MSHFSVLTAAKVGCCKGLPT